MEAERESKMTKTLRQTRMVGLEDRRRRLGWSYYRRVPRVGYSPRTNMRKMQF